MSRRIIFTLVLVLLASQMSAKAEPVDTRLKESSQQQKTFVVYKNPQCGCCDKWIKHINDFGFSSHVSPDLNISAVKSQYGIQPRYRSCHTAVIEGYVFEGHIPAHIIYQFLRDKPQNVIGLSVPGMPSGSPGMEVGDRHDEYQVLLLNKDGSTDVYTQIIE